MKPRIKPVNIPAELLRRPYRWLCISSDAIGYGETIREAYWDWVRNRFAMDTLLRPHACRLAAQL